MIDVLIIGCGVTGAACAYTLARYDLRVAVLEAGSDVAVGTSRANSAIIHAGYDPAPGTDMARLNVRGAALAPEICARLDVPYLPCGSMVLAFDEGDRAHLQKLYDRGCANGVPGLEILSGEEARAREPELAETVVAALWAPSAGIICPWEYTLAMAETAVRNGVELHLRARVTAIERTEYGTFLVKTEDGAEYESRFVVSAAGVDAAAVRALLEEPDYRIIPTRGQYYLLDKSEGGRVGCTVFQCPNEKGKGVLVSPTVHGNLIVGPDAAVGAADDRRAAQRSRRGPAAEYPQLRRRACQLRPRRLHHRRERGLPRLHRPRRDQEPRTHRRPRHCGGRCRNAPRRRAGAAREGGSARYAPPRAL